MASSRTAYSKQNCTFPLEQGHRGWRRVVLEERYEAGVAHFCATPKGSLYRDLEYGNDFYQLRTQSMNEKEDRQFVEVDFQQGFQRYFPDLLLHQVDVIADHDEETRYLAVVWTVRGADEQVHGRLAKPRRTMVTI